MVAVAMYEASKEEGTMRTDATASQAYAAGALQDVTYGSVFEVC